MLIIFAVSSVERQFHRLRVTLINEIYTAELEDRNSEEFMEMSRYVINLVKTLRSMLIMNIHVFGGHRIFWIQIIYLDGIRWLYFSKFANEIEHKYKISWLLYHSKQSFLIIRKVHGLHPYL